MAGKGNPAWQANGGTSGNPSGRSIGARQFSALARTIVDKYVIVEWEREVKERGPDWVECSKLLVLYAYGRPAVSQAGNEESHVTVQGTRLSFAELKEHNAIAARIRDESEDTN